MVSLCELNTKKEIYKFYTKKINKHSNLHKNLTFEIKNLLLLIYLISILFTFHSSLCQDSKTDSLTQNIIYLKVNVTKSDYYPIINNLNYVNSIEINRQTSDISTKYHFDIGEYEMKINFNKTITDCSKLFMDSKSNFIDLSEFDTSQCTLYNSMFKDCTSLTSIKFGNNFNTNKATDMTSMFENVGNNKFISIDLSRFNTSLVKNMRNMFSYSSFKFLNLSNFNTSNVVNMEGMFTNSKIISIYINSFDTSKVTDMSHMFSGCNNLFSLDISNFEFAYLKKCSHIFYQMSAKLKFCAKKTISNLINDELIEANIIEKCNDHCFTNSINKFIISNFSCIDDCKNSNLKYEYNNICYSECPSATEEYPKYSYFCIDKLYYKESFYNYNKVKYTTNISMGYYFDNETQKIKKCPEKCKTCELGSVIMDLCIECNIDNFYYEIKSSFKKIIKYRDCIQITNSSKRYLSPSNNCYETCETCTEFGNSINHKCLSCKPNMIMTKSLNCYNKCPQDKFFYIDYSNKNHCSNKCPYGYQLIYGTQICTKNCTGEFPNMRQYNKTCHELIIPGRPLYNLIFEVGPTMKPGEAMNISNQSFIFNSTGIKNNKKMNFRIKSETYGRDYVEYFYKDHIDENNHDIENKGPFYKSDFNYSKQEREGNYVINYFTIIKDSSEFHDSNGEYLIILYFSRDEKTEITNIQEKEEENEDSMEKENEKEEEKKEKEEEKENEIEKQKDKEEEIISEKEK